MAYKIAPTAFTTEDGSYDGAFFRDYFDADLAETYDTREAATESAASAYRGPDADGVGVLWAIETA